MKLRSGNTRDGGGMQMASLTLLAVVVACGPRVGHSEFSLYMQDHAIAASLQRTADGYFTVVLVEPEPTVLRLRPGGQVEWQHVESASPSGASRLVGVVRLANGGTLLCVDQSEHAVHGGHGALIELDANGNEVARADVVGPGPPLPSVAKVYGCATWGNGLVVIGTDETDSTPTHVDVGRRPVGSTSVLLRFSSGLRFSSALSVEAHIDDAIAVAAPRSFPNGDLVLLGAGYATRLKEDGTVLAQTKTAKCDWVRSEAAAARLRLACLDPLASGSVLITDFDDTLRVTRTTTLDVSYVRSSPIVAELADGRFAVLEQVPYRRPALLSTIDFSATRPRVLFFDARGHPAGLHDFGPGSSDDEGVDLVSLGPLSEVGVLRNIHAPRVFPAIAREWHMAVLSRIRLP